MEPLVVHMESQKMSALEEPWEFSRGKCTSGIQMQFKFIWQLQNFGVNRKWVAVIKQGSPWTGYSQFEFPFQRDQVPFYEWKGCQQLELYHPHTPATETDVSHLKQKWKCIHLNISNSCFHSLDHYFCQHCWQFTYRHILNFYVMKPQWHCRITLQNHFLNKHISWSYIRNMF